jgi:hypothetical protein
MRSDLEVADIFRRHGHAYAQAHDGHLGRIERRVMSAIELCRTAALGGHVETCEDCAHVRVAYNSCLMGISSNGELVCQPGHFSVNCRAFCLHNSALLCLRRRGN